MAIDLEANCALNADGSYKDASQIEWRRSPSDERPMSPSPSAHPAPARGPGNSALVTSQRVKRNANQEKYHEAMEIEKQPLPPLKPLKRRTDASAAPRTRPAQTEGGANGRAKRKSNTENTNEASKKSKQEAASKSKSSGNNVPKSSNPFTKAASARDARVANATEADTSIPTSLGCSPAFPERVSHPESENDASFTMSTRSEHDEPQDQDERVTEVDSDDEDDGTAGDANNTREDDDEGDEGGGGQDILTFSRKLDNGKYECLICAKLKKENPNARIKKTIFNDNTTTMRMHCRRSAKTHFETYKKGCKELKIKMHKTAIPENYRDDSQSKDGMKQLSIVDFSSSKPEAWSKEGLLKEIGEFVVDSNQSINIVENRSFRKLLLFQRGPHAKDTDIPHRTKLTSHINSRAEEIEKELIKTFAELPKGRQLSVTFDGWTSSNMVSYMAVTGHFVSAKWKLRRHLLAFSEMTGSHTAVNQASLLFKIFQKLMVINKLMCLTADNVSVNDKTIEELEFLLEDLGITDFDHRKQRTHCYAHIVALAYKAFLNALSVSKGQKKSDSESDSFDESEEDVLDLLHLTEAETVSSTNEEDLRQLKTVMLKVRGFIVKERRSPQAKAFFLQCCEEKGLRPRELLPFCNTRWESALPMIQRFLENEKAVIHFMNNADDSEMLPKPRAGQPLYSSYKLSTRQWELLRLIRDVLTESNNVQQMFSSEKQPSVYKVLPIFERFRSQWKKLSDDPKYSAVRAAINIGIETIDKYYKRAKVSEANIISLYLIPSMKEIYFVAYWDVSEQARAQLVLEEVFDRYLAYFPKSAESRHNHANTFSGPKGSEFNDDRLRELFNERQNRDRQAPTDSREELSRYLSDPIVEEEECADLLSWWEKHSARYPILSCMAANYLAVQGSSVSCEREFSSAGLVDTKRRNRLLPKQFGAIEFVKAFVRQEREFGSEAGSVPQKRNRDDDEGSDHSDSEDRANKQTRLEVED